jgi:hypothetical protein
MESKMCMVPMVKRSAPIRQNRRATILKFNFAISGGGGGGSFECFARSRVVQALYFRESDFDDITIPAPRRPRDVFRTRNISFEFPIEISLTH